MEKDEVWEDKVVEDMLKEGQNGQEGNNIII